MAKKPKLSQAEREYQHQRDLAASRRIEESLNRKMGRIPDRGYREMNPIRSPKTNNKYDPRRW